MNEQTPAGRCLCQGHDPCGCDGAPMAKCPCYGPTICQMGTERAPAPSTPDTDLRDRAVDAAKQRVGGTYFPYASMLAVEAALEMVMPELASLSTEIQCLRAALEDRDRFEADLRNLLHNFNTPADGA